VSASATVRGSARERLLAAADELFYVEGVQSVGIDRVIARAGVAKASLYNTFGSKDELIRAYLEGRYAQTRARLEAAVAGAPDPRAALLAVFASQTARFGLPGFHGCAFANATAEATPGSVEAQAAEQYRSWFRGLLTGLATEAGARDPELLGRQLQLLYDGGATTARMDRDPAVASLVCATAAALVDAALIDVPRA
jgi:AcrR family transcriptional regulator